MHMKFTKKLNHNCFAIMSSNSNTSRDQDIAVSDALALDAQLTGRYLVNHLPDLAYLRNNQIGSLSCSIKRFSHGQSNPTYLISIDQNRHKYVLRKQPPGTILQGAHQVIREAIIMDFLKKNSKVPVPTIYHICHTSDVIGTPFYIMEYVDGIIYNDVNLPALSPFDRASVYAAVVDALAQLHSVDITKLKDTLRNSSNFCRNQINLWMKQNMRSIKAMQADPASAFPEINRLHSLLEANIPSYDSTSEQSSSLVHGDYRIDNIIFDKRNPGKILAILDWELASLGDRLVDLSYFCLPYHIPRVPLLANMSLERKSADDETNYGIPTEKDVVKSYLKLEQAISNRSATDAMKSHWDFYLALGLFRISCIMTGIIARSRQGNASRGKEAGAVFTQIVPILAKRGVVLLSPREKMTGQSSNSNTSRTSLNEIRQGYPISAHAMEYLKRLRIFVDEECIPLESRAIDHVVSNGRWSLNPAIETLKKRAKELKLWNFWISPSIFNELKAKHPSWNWSDILPHAQPMSNLDYAYLAIESGRSLLCPEAINCSAPDTGNMEILAKFGTVSQNEAYLLPLLLGETRSCFGMTEINVSSSDPTQLMATAFGAESSGKSSIQSSNKLGQGDALILNGKKWWTTGACHPHVSVCIVVAVTDESRDGPKHQRHTLFAVPMNREGVKVVRPLHVFGFDDAPHGHAEVHFNGVKLHSGDILGKLGEGFALAQARLGPGRLHHCARLVGHCIRGIEEVVKRGQQRQAFGKALLELGGNRERLARSRIAQRQAQLTILDGAATLDEEEKAHESSSLLIKKLHGKQQHSYHKPSEKLLTSLAALKVSVPSASQEVLDFAIQLHGGGGLSMEHPLAAMWAAARTLRLVDGPDEVHLRVLSANTIKTVGTGTGTGTGSGDTRARQVKRPEPHHPGVGNSRL